MKVMDKYSFKNIIKVIIKALVILEKKRENRGLGVGLHEEI